jgi:hypothetical protein
MTRFMDAPRRQSLAWNLFAGASGMTVFLALAACGGSSSVSVGGSARDRQPAAAIAGIDVPAACGSLSSTTGLASDGGLTAGYECYESYRAPAASDAEAKEASSPADLPCPSDDIACACLIVDTPGECLLSITYAQGRAHCDAALSSGVCTVFKSFTSAHAGPN